MTDGFWSPGPPPSSSAVLAFMGFPKAHRLQIHSTNPLERLNAEVKRRTDVVGIFPNEAAIRTPSRQRSPIWPLTILRSS